MFVSNCCIHPLEQPAAWYSVILLLDRFLPQTRKTNRFQAFNIIYSCFDFASVDFVTIPAILAALKFPIWLINWVVKRLSEAWKQRFRTDIYLSALLYWWVSSRPIWNSLDHQTVHASSLNCLGHHLSNLKKITKEFTWQTIWTSVFLRGSVTITT